jgi:hypothetical protein
MAEAGFPYGRRALALGVLLILVALCAWAWARPSARASLAPTAVLTVDVHHPGNAFRSGAVGLSTEAQELSAGQLTSVHPDLVRLMRLMGPSVLRIGGGTVDFSWWTSNGEAAPSWAENIITPADLVDLHTLLNATGWRVLLGVDLGHFEPARAADEARNAQRILGTALLGIEVGNEPNSYPRTKGLRPASYNIGGYLGEAAVYGQALRAAVPGLALYGPSLSGTGRWLNQIGPNANLFTELTQHYYPTSVCPATPSSLPPATVSGLLSIQVRQEEDELLASLLRAGRTAGRPVRIGETNGVSCGGSESASPVLASALWALDWSLRTASSGASGLNFHGRLGVCGSHSPSSVCAPSEAAAMAGEVVAQPEFYGLLAARLLEGGRFVPTHVNALAPLPNLTTWATLAPNGTLRIAIDNLATSGPAQPVLISRPGYVIAAERKLIGSSLQARSGITLGTAPVTGTGLWRPATRPPASISQRVIVRPASAVILTLRLKHQPGHRRRRR